jgi:hypothetical protein
MEFAVSFPPTTCPERCPLCHLCERFVFYDGVLCSSVNVRLNLLQVAFDPSTVFYLQVGGLSYYPFLFQFVLTEDA